MTTSPAEFVHLHLHSSYSLLDGAIRLPDLMKHCRDTGMKAVALTDHGNMYGAIDFYQRCERAEIKPIIGAETYLAPQGRFDRTETKNWHLVLLAKNEVGYKNLCHLVSVANIEGLYYRPRIDKELLEQHHEGLIATSACLKGEIPQAILNGHTAGAREAAAYYKDLFGDDFYLEIQETGFLQQMEVNNGILTIAKELGIPVVGTFDAHFLQREDYEAHQALVAIGKRTTFDNPILRELYTAEQHVQTPEEAVKAFSYHPEAVRNTLEIAEKIELKLFLGYPSVLPNVEHPDRMTAVEHLREQATKGLNDRIPTIRRMYEGKSGSTFDEQTYRDRLDKELDIIERMNANSYFLVVSDYVRYAKDSQIPVGPGRSSSAGSLAAYALQITDLDPLPYNLLFERFLNPERVAMPDFDIDFCMNRRGEIVHYLSEKYGMNNIARIATFGILRARAVLKDVARVMGWEPAESQKLANLIDPSPGMTLDNAWSLEPKIKDWYRSDTQMARVWDIAKRLDGLHRHISLHAAGVVITDKPTWDYVPIWKEHDGYQLITQYAKNEVEEAGLVKFDLLGLRILTVIDNTIKLVNQSRERKGKDLLTYGHMADLADPEVYKMIARADVYNVFQMESRGFQRMLQDLKPDCFEDIIAAVALYRPGPMDLIPDFCDRKHGRTAIVYEHELLEEILRPTYGIIIYQEQMMQIASAMGGFSLGKADILRRAMGKKVQKYMDQMKGEFMEGAKERGVTDKTAQHVWAQMDKFSSYGFNKSHAAAYAVLSYQTAYLKHYHPVEFMAANLTSTMDQSDKIAKNIQIARQMGIQVLPPCACKSLDDFSVEDGGLRFGLGAIRGVSEAAIEAVQEAREGKEFEGLFDFCQRVDANRINRIEIEQLIKAGAFDFTGVSRTSLFATVEKALNQSQRVNNADEYDGGVWTEEERLGYERNVLGVYLTGHPLDRFKTEIDRYGTHTTETLIEVANLRAEVAICGVLLDVADRPNRADPSNRTAFGQLEDLHGVVDFLMFDDAFREFGKLLRMEEPLLVTGMVRIEEVGEERTPKIIVRQLTLLSELRQEQN